MLLNKDTDEEKNWKKERDLQVLQIYTETEKKREREKRNTEKKERERDHPEWKFESWFSWEKFDPFWSWASCCKHFLLGSEKQICTSDILENSKHISIILFNLKFFYFKVKSLNCISNLSFNF